MNSPAHKEASRMDSTVREKERGASVQVSGSASETQD